MCPLEPRWVRGQVADRITVPQTAAVCLSAFHSIVRRGHGGATANYECSHIAMVIVGQMDGAVTRANAQLSRVVAVVCGLGVIVEHDHLPSSPRQLPSSEMNKERLTGSGLATAWLPGAVEDAILPTVERGDRVLLEGVAVDPTPAVHRIASQGRDRGFWQHGAPPATTQTRMPSLPTLWDTTRAPADSAATLHTGRSGSRIEVHDTAVGRLGSLRGHRVTARDHRFMAPVPPRWLALREGGRP